MNHLAMGAARRGHDVIYISSEVPGRPKREVSSGVHLFRMGNRLTLAAHAFQYYMKYLKGKLDVIIEEVAGGAFIPFLASCYVKEPIVGVWYQRNKLIYMNQFPRPISWSICLLDEFISRLHKHDLLIVLSQDRANDIMRLGISANKVRIIPPGFQFGKIENRLRLSDNHPAQTFVFLNKIRKYKAIHHLIYAFEQVYKKHPNSRLIIAGKRGDVRYELFLRKVVKKLKLETCIKFRINIPDSEVNKLLSNARALVLPSPIEGFSQVCLWANAHGTPAIVSTGVPRDAVHDMCNGIVVPFNDIDAWTSAMVRLIEDQELFSLLSSNAKERVKKYDWEESIDKFLQVLSEI